MSARESAIRRVAGGASRLIAEQDKARDGSRRPLSLEERESVASTVEAWIREGVHADVDRVIAEVCTELGFVPPVSVWREVGDQLRLEEYMLDSRPGLLVSTLRTLQDGSGDGPTDEEQTLCAALVEQRRAENEERHRNALKRYEQDLDQWRSTGRRWLRSSNWPKPTKPAKKDPHPPSQTEVAEFRKDLVLRMTRVVRERIEQMYTHWELGGGGGAPSVAKAGDVVSRQRQPSDRDDYTR